MVKRKSGQFISGGAILKVMFWEAQTVCCIRIW